MAEKKGKTKIPSGVLSNSGLKQAKTIDGNKMLVPLAVSDEFQKALGQSALWGDPNRGVSSSQYLNLFNYYLQNVLESKTTQRLDRYEQMDFIIENDPALALTRRVLVDEILQVDMYNEPITVTSPNLKFKKKIEELFKNLGVKSYLKEYGSNLISYGDAFMIMDINGKQGVVKLIPVDPRDVTHRFEFSLAQLKQSKTKLLKKYTAYQAMINLASTIETNASEFNKVLLGFQVLNTMFPFWQVLHARQFTTRNTLAPFGKPTFYESQSEARMYLNAKVVVSMIRASAFMREHIQVKTKEGEDAASQWQKVQEVKQMMELFITTSGTQSSKDYPSFGDKLYYPEGLITIEKMEAGYNFRDRFADLELMRQDVFTSTGLPKEYFVGGENRQYVSDKSLVSQDKKAARQVFALQSYMIDQMIKLVEVHFSYTGEFDPYKEEFGISLPYPVPDTDDSVISLSTAKMQYAISTIDQLKQSLEITRIPEPIIRSMLAQYFPLKDEEVELLLKQMQNDSKKEDEIGFDRIGMKAGDPFLQNKEMMGQQMDQIDQQMDTEDQTMTSPTSVATKTPAPTSPGIQQIAAHYVNHIKNRSLTESFERKAFKVYRDEIATIHMDEFNSVMKKKSFNETFQKILSVKLLEKSDEFVYSGRHFLTNSHTSPDRNIKAAFAFKDSEALQEGLKSMQNKDFGRMGEGTHKMLEYERTSLNEGKFVMKNPEKGEVIEDSLIDKRYNIL